MLDKDFIDIVHFGGKKLSPQVFVLNWTLSFFFLCVFWERASVSQIFFLEIFSVTICVTCALFSSILRGSIVEKGITRAKLP